MAIQSMDHLSIGLFQAIITILVWYIASYVKEKGKNLATKEDIHEITRQIESAKMEYAKELEGIKSQLNAKFHAQTVRYEKELQIYEDIWKTQVELRNAAVKLRPPGDFYSNGDNSSEQEKQTRFELYSDSFNAFFLAFYANKPFIHSNVLSCLADLTDLIVSEASEFKKRLDFEIGPTDDTHYYWKEAQNNIDLIMKKTDTICDKIRQRIESF